MTCGSWCTIIQTRSTTRTWCAPLLISLFFFTPLVDSFEDKCEWTILEQKAHMESKLAEFITMQDCGNAKKASSLPSIRHTLTCFLLAQLRRWRVWSTKTGLACLKKKKFKEVSNLRLNGKKTYCWCIDRDSRDGLQTIIIQQKRRLRKGKGRRKRISSMAKLGWKGSVFKIASRSFLCSFLQETDAR